MNKFNRTEFVIPGFEDIDMSESYKDKKISDAAIESIKKFRLKHGI